MKLDAFGARARTHPFRRPASLTPGPMPPCSPASQILTSFWSGSHQVFDFIFPQLIHTGKFRQFIRLGKTMLRKLIAALLALLLVIEPPLLYAQTSNNPDVVDGILTAMSFKSILDGLKSGDKANLPSNGTLTISQQDLDAYRALNGGVANAKMVQTNALQKQQADKAANGTGSDPVTWIYKSATTGADARAYGASIGQQASTTANAIAKGNDPAGSSLRLADWFAGCTETPDGRGGFSQSCNGPIRCMGNSCYKPAGEQNADFAQAASASQIVQSMRDGMVCKETGKAPRDDFGCTPTSETWHRINQTTGLPEDYKQDVCKESGDPITLDCNGVPTPLVGILGDIPTTFPGCKVTNKSLPTTSYPENCTPRLFVGTVTACNSYLGASVGLANDCCDMGAKAGANVNYIPVAKAIYNQSGLSSYVSSATAQYTQPVVEYFQPMWESAKTSIGNLVGTGSGASAATSSTSMGMSVSSSEAMANSASAIGDAVSGPLAEISEVVQDELVTATEQSLAADAGEAAAADAMKEQLGSAMEMVNVFMMYYAIASFIGHMLTKCDSSEIQQGVEIAERKCVKMPSYCAKTDPNDLVNHQCVTQRTKACCYPSMIARIMGSQIKAQIHPGVPNGGYGAPDAPDCDGIGPDDLANVNWEQIDLSEWLQTMQQGGFGAAQSQADVDRMMSPTANQVQSRFGVSPPGQTIVDRVQGQIDKFAPLTQTGLLEQTRATSYSSEQLCYLTDTSIPTYTQTPITVSPEDVIVPVGGSGVTEGSIRPCGPGCIEVVLGREGTQYLQDTCTKTFDQYFDVLVKRPDLITSARVVAANWDDHMRIKVDSQEVFVSNKFYASIASPIQSVCELSTDWHLFQNYIPPEAHGLGYIDVTSNFKVGGYIRTNTSVRTWGTGNAFAIVRIEYTTTPTTGQIGPCIAPAVPQ